MRKLKLYDKYIYKYTETTERIDRYMETIKI